jgi:hypothetical protein
MDQERRFARSPNNARLVKKLRKKEYRDEYVSSHNRQFLAAQIRAIRGDASQKEFGALIEKPQSVVSRLEDPYDDNNRSLQTLFEVAAKTNRAVIARIVDFATFVRLTSDMSQEALAPPEYSDEQLNEMIDGEENEVESDGPAVRAAVKQQPQDNAPAPSRGAPPARQQTLDLTGNTP